MLTQEATHRQSPEPLLPRSAASNAHVVILNNYLRKHHVVVYRELQKHVGKLTILLSTTIEANRQFEPEWEGLNVEVQRNWTYNGIWQHKGFSECTYIHFPVDTAAQLKRLQPDVVMSYELGLRTLLSSWFRAFNRDVPLIMVGNMSEHIERDRGFFRKALRSVLKRTVDYATYNGPSCKRYLSSIGFEEDRMMHAPYCYNDASAWQGDKTFDDDGPLKIIMVGFVNQRKGVVKMAKLLQEFSTKLTRKIQLVVCGTGPDEEKVSKFGTSTFEVLLKGNCSPKELRDEYRKAQICLYPSLGDEWGLVPIEAMASGIPVLGSRLAQSVEAVIEHGRNGWVVDTENDQLTRDMLWNAIQTPPEKLSKMSVSAREAVSHISAQACAQAFLRVINHSLQQ